MPHLTIPIQADRGPIIRLLIGASEPRLAALREAGRSLPNPVVVSMLIDTGASCTAIDERALAPLGLTPTGSTQVSTPTTGTAPEARLTYDVGVMLYHTDNSRLFNSVPVIATDFGAQGIDGLFGRDLLASCLLVYDGATGNFSLAF